MGSLTDFSEDELLDHIYNAAYTPPATVYLAYATASITDTDDGSTISEPTTDTGYDRTAITFGVAASRRVTQSGTVTFPQATGSQGTVTDWAVCDGNTRGAGNVLAYGTFAAGKSIVSGNTPSVASAEVYVEFSANEISDYLANALLDFMFRNQAYSMPDTYVALCTATISDTDDGSSITEPSGNGYARKQVNVNGGSSPTWNLASASVVDNADDVDLGPASGGSWGTLVAVAILDALSAGNLLMYDNAMADQAVGDGDTARFPAGDLDCEMS
jgi:hypothetical protein